MKDALEHPAAVIVNDVIIEEPVEDAQEQPVNGIVNDVIPTEVQEQDLEPILEEIMQ